MINEIKRMQRLAGITEIKVVRPSSLLSIINFYNEHINQDWDGEDEFDMPDWGGPDNLHDGGPEEFDLESFLGSYEGMLSKEDIILLWLYTFSYYLEGDIEEENELTYQIKELGYSEDDIDNFVDIIKSDAKNT